MIPRNPSWSNMSPWEALLSWGSHCHLPLPRGCCCLVAEAQPFCWVRESCQTAAWAQVERGQVAWCSSRGGWHEELPVLGGSEENE